MSYVPLDSGLVEVDCLSGCNPHSEAPCAIISTKKVQVVDRKMAMFIYIDRTCWVISNLIGPMVELAAHLTRVPSYVPSCHNA